MTYGPNVNLIRTRTTTEKPFTKSRMPAAVRQELPHNPVCAAAFCPGSAFLVILLLAAIRASYHTWSYRYLQLFDHSSHCPKLTPRPSTNSCCGAQGCCAPVNQSVPAYECQRWLQHCTTRPSALRRPSCHRPPSLPSSNACTRRPPAPCRPPPDLQSSPPYPSPPGWT